MHQHCDDVARTSPWCCCNVAAVGFIPNPIQSDIIYVKSVYLIHNVFIIFVSFIMPTQTSWGKKEVDRQPGGGVT